MINQKFLSLLRSHQIQSIEKTESTKNTETRQLSFPKE